MATTYGDGGGAARPKSLCSNDLRQITKLSTKQKVFRITVSLIIVRIYVKFCIDYDDVYTIICDVSPYVVRV